MCTCTGGVLALYWHANAYVLHANGTCASRAPPRGERAPRSGASWPLPPMWPLPVCLLLRAACPAACSWKQSHSESRHSKHGLFASSDQPGTQCSRARRAFGLDGKVWCLRPLGLRRALTVQPLSLTRPLLLPLRATVRGSIAATWRRSGRTCRFRLARARVKCLISDEEMSNAERDRVRAGGRARCARPVVYLYLLLKYEDERSRSHEGIGKGGDEDPFFCGDCGRSRETTRTTRATPDRRPRLQPGWKRGTRRFFSLTSLSLITSLRCRISFRYQRLARDQQQ